MHGHPQSPTWHSVSLLLTHPSPGTAQAEPEQQLGEGNKWGWAELRSCDAAPASTEADHGGHKLQQWRSFSLSLQLLIIH